jgi:hypothetical protein
MQASGRRASAALKRWRVWQESHFSATEWHCRQAVTSALGLSAKWGASTARSMARAWLGKPKRRSSRNSSCWRAWQPAQTVRSGMRILAWSSPWQASQVTGARPLGAAWRLARQSATMPGVRASWQAMHSSPLNWPLIWPSYW